MTQANKVAVVAGGTAGVGRETVHRLINAGFQVGVLARGKQRLEEVAKQYGSDVLCLQCDVSDANQVSKAGAAIEETLGAVRVWINAAMLTSFSPFHQVKAEEFERIVNTTLLGVVNGTRTALALMRTRGEGRIVNVGSGLSYRSVPYQAAYCSAKHAINGFTSSIRTELIHDQSRITISVVQLPAINTPQFEWARNRLENKPQPAPPIYQPEVAARAVMRAVKEGKREYFVGKSVIQLVFGNMVLPNWLDSKLAEAGAKMQKSDQSEPGGRADNLENPIEDVAARAHGRFDANAESSGIIVDADQLRLVVFLGIPLAIFLLGLVIG